MVQNPLNYDGETIRGVCPGCEKPCLADKFNGRYVCGRCGHSSRSKNDFRPEP